MVGQILFAAVEFAGTVVGFQMGLSMANVFDPQSQAQISLIGQFERIFATLIFVAMDGHLVVVQAIVRSYDLLPPGGANFSDSLTQEMIRLSAGVFTLGFQLGAPLITALFLANLTMALLARSVPQIQIFIVGFPLTLLLGFMVLMFGVPFFAQALHRMFEMYDDQLLNMLRILALPGAP
jgi:flagellar biosynthetic protein FliR